MKKIVMPEDDKMGDLFRVYIYDPHSGEDGKDFFYEDYDMALRQAERNHRAGLAVIVYRNEVIDCEYEQ